MSSLRQTILVSFLLLALTAGIYSRVCTHEFVNYDDWMITDNIHIQRGLSLDNVKWAFTRNLGFGFRGDDYWAPMAYLTHMIDFDLHGANPGGHHLTNLLIHVLSVLILFAALHRMTHAFWQSAFVAALFAVHPLGVEPVAWIINRKVLLSGLFSMLTLWCYACYVERPGLGRYLSVAFCFTLALMSKASAMALPLALLLLDFWPLRRASFGPLMVNAWRRCLIEKIPLLLLTFAFIIQAALSMKNVGNLENFDRLPISIRAANALVSCVIYLRKFIWPSDLAFFYPHLGHSLSAWEVGSSTFLLLSITLLVAREWRRFPFLVVGWFWFLGNLVPLMGFVQSGAHAMADRHMYLPILGLGIITAWGGADLWNHIMVSRGSRFIIRRSAFLMVGILLLLLAWTTWGQSGTWRNSEALFRHATQVTRGNYLAHSNLGKILLDRGNLEEATHEFEQAVKSNPIHHPYRNNLGLAYLQQGRVSDALQQFQEAHKRFPNEIKTRCNLGIALVRAGKINDAIRLYEDSLRLDPKLPDLHNLLGNAFLSQGKHESAYQAYLNALQLDPHFAEAHYNLANLLTTQGKMSNAIPHYQDAVRLKPDYPMAHYNLGICLVQTGKPQEGLSSLKIALAQQPDFEPARQTIADLEKHKVR